MNFVLNSEEPQPSPGGRYLVAHLMPLMSPAPQPGAGLLPSTEAMYTLFLAECLACCD